jgi:hypothetical protein
VSHVARSNPKLKGSKKRAAKSTFKEFEAVSDPSERLLHAHTH